VQLGSLPRADQRGGPFAVEQDSCSNQLLEPDQRCTVAVSFRPVTGGEAATTLLLPSDNGVLQIPVSAVAPSVSSLTSPQLAEPEFRPTGVGRIQRFVLSLTNPLLAPVRVEEARVSGTDARRFRIQSDRCVRVELAPGGECSLAVVFTPKVPGTAHALLTVRGDGVPLRIRLRARPSVLPDIALLGSSEGSTCFVPAAGHAVEVLTDEPSSVTWRAVRRRDTLSPRCRSSTEIPPPPASAGRTSASGSVSPGGRWSLAPGIRTYVTRFLLPVDAGPAGLRPGAYRLTITVTHGARARRSKTAWLTVMP
jgi:Abnormal spindle-like microcephaly-assoc'd, ASPM-SPD-2-Hydin